jgi:predicted homoserine dehydrogenase-like protein
LKCQWAKLQPFKRPKNPQVCPSLSATNAENQQIAKQTPSFAPKNVKSGVFVLFKIIQPLHNKRVAILKESDEKRLIFIYPFSLIFQDFTSS